MKYVNDFFRFSILNIQSIYNKQLLPPFSTSQSQIMLYRSMHKVRGTLSPIKSVTDRFFAPYPENRSY
jgi:hypothetical protein